MIAPYGIARTSMPRVFFKMIISFGAVVQATAAAKNKRASSPGRRGLLPNGNNREAGDLSLRERVREARVRARPPKIESIRALTRPSASLSRRVRAPALTMIVVGQQP